MIQFSEVVTGPIKPEHQDNVKSLIEKVNLFLADYEKRVRVSSGYRSMAKHLAIYAAKGITDESKIPMKSNHLVGLAVDLVPLDEPIEKFHEWIIANKEKAVELGIWFEHFSATATWAHMQIVAPKSGNRFFMP